MGGKLNFAILAGFCASAASLFGKLSGLPTFEGLFIVRIIFFALMIICNAGVWTLFVKALQNVESSLTATVISAASNYCLSVGIDRIFNFWRGDHPALVVGDVFDHMWTIIDTAGPTK
ncbi:uncharacterized protein LOC123015118 isoform X2 [Tribolium madens]|uniref:uncharacterized protein LOC123015118 isoform X2 n=1 Tax=Tribolium madens TaxID=41895 RepID=UPI001CF75BD0|nr:uncharacterized protein LOC123015118 isoform X2 [Tribolium madens]